MKKRQVNIGPDPLNTMWRLRVIRLEMSKPYRLLVALVGLCFLGGGLLVAMSSGVWHRIGHDLFRLKPANFANTTVAPYPVKVGPDGRYLVDQDGKPFMMV